MTYDDKQPDSPAEEHPELLTGLDALRQTIDQAKYPGQAWPVKKRGRGVIFKLTAGALAAAAAVVLFVSLQNADNTNKPAGPKAKENQPVAQAKSQSASPEISLSVGSPEIPRVAPKIANLSHPQISHACRKVNRTPLPKLTVSFSNASSIKLPTLSFPITQERKNENEQEQDSNSSSTGRNRRLLRNIHNRPDQREV